MQSESIIIHATPNDILLPTVHLREMLSVNQVSEEIIKSCEEALSELLKNIVDHACEEEEQLITVNIAYNDSGVYIETQDEGIPVDFAISKLISAKNLEPAFHVQEEADLSSKNILDEIWYEIDMGKNIWQLVKYI
jgi:anti-sigma regulatory factor (Ser/Thr protein kinase)